MEDVYIGKIKYQVLLLSVYRTCDRPPTLFSLLFLLPKLFVCSSFWIALSSLTA